VACDSGSDTVVATEPRVAATVTVAIGELDGPDEYVFGRVSGVAGDASRVFISDHQADIIRAYDTSGTFLFTIARRGQGPGEVRRPCCLALDRQGRLWVRDGGNGRYNAYRVGGEAEFVTSYRMVHNSRGMWAAPTFAANGDLIDIGYGPRTDRGPTTTRHYLDSAGALRRQEDLSPPPVDSVPVHTVTRSTNGGVVTQFFQQAFGATHLIAHSAFGGFATAVSSHYDVRWVGPDSAFDHRLMGPFVERRVAAFERDSALALWSERLRFAEMTLSDLPFGVPDRHPALRHLQFDMLGRLWVHLTPAREGPYEARVHDRSGQAILIVQWPRDIDLRSGFIGSDFALGIRTDSLGVQEVVRLKF
jgi:hypothetical protein